MVIYPEHEKMESIVNELQRIGEFIDWLQDTKKIFLSEYHTYTDTREYLSKPGTYEVQVTELGRIRTNIQNLLAGFFGIDLNKIEAEKRAMLEEIRSKL